MEKERAVDEMRAEVTKELEPLFTMTGLSPYIVLGLSLIAEIRLLRKELADFKDQVRSDLVDIEDAVGLVNSSVRNS